MGNVQKPYFVQNCLPCGFIYGAGLDQHKRTALFWTVTLRVVVIPYRRFGTICPICKGQIGFLK